MKCWGICIDLMFLEFSLCRKNAVTVSVPVPEHPEMQMLWLYIYAETIVVGHFLLNLAEVNKAFG